MNIMGIDPPPVRIQAQENVCDETAACPVVRMQTMVRLRDCIVPQYRCLAYR